MFNPQYSLAIKNEYCQFMAYLNDIPVMFNPNGYAFNLNFPINHLICSGKNTFRIEVTIQNQSPSELEYFDFTCEVLVKGESDHMADLKTLVSANFREIYKMPLANVPPNSPLIGEFHIKHPVYDAPWIDRIDLKKDKGHFIKLAMSKLIDFHKCLLSNDLEKIFLLISLRETHYSSRYFENYNLSFNKTKEDFNNTIEDKNYILQRIDFATYLPVFHANGRLITFENKFGEQAIFYLNNKENKRRQYPLFFFCTSKDEIEIGL